MKLFCIVIIVATGIEKEKDRRDDRGSLETDTRKKWDA